MRESINPNELTLTENVIKINRVAKVVKGGRRFSFSALVVAGDKKGHVGIGLGKANEVPEAIRKGAAQAKRALIRIPLKKGTITQSVQASYGSGMVLLKPASDGTGVIAGGPVRAVVEAAGVQNLLSKSLGTSNPHNVVKATMRALEHLRDSQEIFIARGGTIETDIFESKVEGTETGDAQEKRSSKKRPGKNTKRKAGGKQPKVSDSKPEKKLEKPVDKKNEKEAEKKVAQKATSIAKEKVDVDKVSEKTPVVEQADKISEKQSEKANQEA